MAVADGQAPHGSEPMVGGIASLVHEHVPSEAMMLVASGGEEDLLGLTLGACEFPNPAAPGVYDASGLAAIAQLEAERARGAEFLLIPGAELWRLEEDRAFEHHLAQRYRLLVDDDLAMLFALRSHPDGESRLWGNLRRTIARCERELDRHPVILDWRTGHNLKAQFPELRIFSPLRDGATLPYIDETIDVVVLLESATRAEMGEARRVASLAILSVPASPTGGSLEVEWKHRGHAGFDNPSVIVPCLERSENVRAGLSSLRETLDEADVEVVLGCGPAQLERGSPAGEWADLDDRVRVVEVGHGASLADACNSAAASATNEILVFLSPVGCPLAEWLSPLPRIFRDRPDAGAVGGKVLTEHGELLHAGAELLADGSPHVSGHGANADDPFYSCVRAVDLVSPALLATPREVFSAAEGLDTKSSSPAMDYCLRLRHQDRRVYYQPASAVVLLELCAGLGFPIASKHGNVPPTPSSKGGR